MSKHLTFLLFLPLLFLSCGGDNFDDASFPPDQQSVELAFKRMADHGALEPVLEVGQLVDGWQFHVGATREGSVMNGPTTKTVWISDRSGIAYSVTSQNSPGIIDELKPGTYGYARGRVHSVDRDLAAGELEAELLLTNWTERKN